jgi:hypothetical protein
MLERSTDAAHLSRVMSHPEVARWMMGLPPPYDASPLVSNPDNVYLANEHGGFLFLKQEANAVYEVHTQLLPEGRGNSLPLARFAAWYMFTKTDCEAIETYVPHDNHAALGLTKAMGFEHWIDCHVLSQPCSIYILTLKQWARSLCQPQSH